MSCMQLRLGSTQTPQTAGLSCTMYNIQVHPHMLFMCPPTAGGHQQKEVLVVHLSNMLAHTKFAHRAQNFLAQNFTGREIPTQMIRQGYS